MTHINKLVQAYEHVKVSTNISMKHQRTQIDKIGSTCNEMGEVEY